MTGPPAVPRYVTRFYGNVDFALDVIANRQITFVHVTTMNDPFDPYFFLETDFGESRSQLLKYIRHSHPSEESRFKRHITAESWQRTIKELKDKLIYWKESTFAFSTSAEAEGLHPKDNLYMWGHYGNGHRGVALEFDTHELALSLLTHHENLNRASPATQEVWANIEYRKTFPPLTAEHYFEFMKQEMDFHSGKIVTRGPTQLDHYYNLMGRVKGEIWAKENEWRLMWRNDTTRMKIYRCPVTVESIVTLYLGLNLAASSKQDFVAEAKHNFPTAQVLFARKRFGDLALDFTNHQG
jgi:Protein of unknown function (DUF2971)